MAREPHVSADDLLTAFGVTRADVDLNTRGLLAPAQARLLRRIAVASALWALLLGAGLGALWFAAVEEPVAWWQWVLVVLLEAALLGVAARGVRTMLLAAADGRVVRHGGPIDASARRGKHLTVEGLTYSVPIPLSRLVQGAAYDVYVVERSATVVAMAPRDTLTG